MNILLFLFGFGVLIWLFTHAFSLWVNDIVEFSLFGKKVNLNRIYRVDRDLMGAHRRYYGLFLMCFTVGMMLCAIGFLDVTPFIGRAGLSIAGLAFLLYGLYGIIKREIVAPPPNGSSLSTGIEAVCYSLFYLFFGGLSILVTYMELLK